MMDPTGSSAAIDVLATLDESSVGPMEVTASQGASLSSDVAEFGRLIQQLDSEVMPSVSPVTEAIMQPLDFLDGQAQNLADEADAAMASEGQMTPSEIVELTVMSQEFMFHSQLVANVANRTADGLQQLFRQQG